MTVGGTHRLDGLEPDNLLAFMALLGLLRTLEEARPGWRPRASWTVAEPPLRPRGERERDGTHVLSWPIWREAVGLAGIRALLGHPRLDNPGVRAALGVVERRQARRISSGKYMNVTRAAAAVEDSALAPTP